MTAVVLEHQDAWCPHGEDLEILDLLAQGATIQTAARRVRMSERTVRRRLRSMAEELCVETTMEVVVSAVRRGLI